MGALFFIWRLQRAVDLRWAARPVNFFHQARRPAIANSDAIGNAVVRMMGIEPESGHQLVRSAKRATRSD